MLLIGSHDCGSAALAEGQIELVTSALITVPLDDVGAQALLQALGVPGHRSFLVQADAVLVEVEVDGLDRAAHEDALAILTFVAFRAIGRGGALAVWDAIAAVATLSVRAVGVILTQPSTDPRLGALALPAPAAWAVQIALAAPRLSSAGVGLTDHARVHDIAVTILSAVPADHVHADLSV